MWPRPWSWFSLHTLQNSNSRSFFFCCFFFSFSFSFIFFFFSLMLVRKTIEKKGGSDDVCRFSLFIRKGPTFNPWSIFCGAHLEKCDSKRKWWMKTIMAVDSTALKFNRVLTTDAAKLGICCKRKRLRETNHTKKFIFYFECTENICSKYYL